MTELLTNLPDEWGPKVELDRAALALTRTGPNELITKTTVHTALVFYTPQPKRELAINSNRKIIKDVPMGGLELLPAGSDVISRWRRTKENILFAMTEERLSYLAGVEFGRDDVEIDSPLSASSDSQLMSLTNMVRREIINGNAAFDPLLLDSLQCAFWIYILRKHSSIPGGSGTVSKGGLTPHAMRRIEEFMRANYFRKITIDELAQVAGLSPSHFMRAFRETCGTTANQYLVEIRLAYAAELIVKTDYSLASIARECGFGSNSYMTAVMRQHWQTTPTELRISQRSRTSMFYTRSRYRNSDANWRVGKSRASASQ